MKQPEFEIEIKPNGKVTVHVKGVSGQQCMNYADMLAEIIGKEESREKTSEYYEQTTDVRIQTHVRKK